MHFLEIFFNHWMALGDDGRIFGKGPPGDGHTEAIANHFKDFLSSLWFPNALCKAAKISWMHPRHPGMCYVCTFYSPSPTADWCLYEINCVFVGDAPRQPHNIGVLLENVTF